MRLGATLILILTAGCSLAPEGDPLRPRHFSPEQAAAIQTRTRTAPAGGPQLRLGWVKSAEHLGARIAQFGFAPAKNDYHRWLQRGHVIVSTALQENFGFSVVEAVHRGCLPLLPRRLSYPEIIPDRFHDLCLYADQADLTDRLAYILDHRHAFRQEAAELQTAMGRYAWKVRIAEFDARLTAAAAAAPRAPLADSPGPTAR